MAENDYQTMTAEKKKKTTNTERRKKERMLRGSSSFREEEINAQMIPGKILDGGREEGDAISPNPWAEGTVSSGTDVLKKRSQKRGRTTHNTGCGRNEKGGESAPGQVPKKKEGGQELRWDILSPYPAD